MSLLVGRSPALGHERLQFHLFFSRQSQTVLLGNHILPTSQSYSCAPIFLYLISRHFNIGRLLDQSQGGMCIYDASGIGLGFSQKACGP